MQEFLNQYYLWIRALHLISVISWMAGMLYLPRLFVYHCSAAKGSELSQTLKLMERRLIRFIMNPASIATWVFGLLMLYISPQLLGEGWMHAKLTCVLFMTFIYHLFIRWWKAFERDENTRPEKFYRIVNEVPTVLMIAIVILAIVNPF